MVIFLAPTEMFAPQPWIYSRSGESFISGFAKRWLTFLCSAGRYPAPKYSLPSGVMNDMRGSRQEDSARLGLVAAARPASGKHRSRLHSDEVLIDVIRGVDVGVRVAVHEPHHGHHTAPHREGSERSSLLLARKHLYPWYSSRLIHSPCESADVRRRGD